MKWLLEMHIPRWADDESYNKLVVVEALDIDAAVKVAVKNLDKECSGPKEWGGPSLIRYANLSNMKPDFVDFDKAALKPRKPVRCPHCHSKVENEPDAEGRICCSECGCEWNPNKKCKG